MIRCIYERKIVRGFESTGSCAVSMIEVSFTTLKQYEEFVERYIKGVAGRELLIINSAGHDI